MRSHREIGAWICKSLSMTNCLWCVINICFTFHSGTNINFKHKSKWPEAVSQHPRLWWSPDSWQYWQWHRAAPCLHPGDQQREMRAAGAGPSSWPGMESEILAAPAWRRAPAAAWPAGAGTHHPPVPVSPAASPSWEMIWECVASVSPTTRQKSALFV